MVKHEFKKMDEKEMKLAKLEQRRYIRNNLKGSDYFFSKIGLNRENEVSALEQEVTEYGFNKSELDKCIEEKNAVLELAAIENNLSNEFNGSDISQNELREQDAQNSLKDIMELLTFTGNVRPETKEERPLTEHEQVLKKIDELKQSNMTSWEREQAAHEQLRNDLDQFFSRD